jgi:hypothetical protein
MSDVMFWPVRRTAVRSLRRGDLIHAPLGPDTVVLAKVTDFEDHESSTIIAVQVEFANGESGVKNCRPWDMVDRMVQPGEPPEGSESIMVHADEMWKWLNVDMNDPEGSGDKYILRTFRRVHSDETGQEAIELRIQGKVNPQEVRICTFKPKGTIGFKGHR